MHTIQHMHRDGSFEELQPQSFPLVTIKPVLYMIMACWFSKLPWSQRRHDYSWKVIVFAIGVWVLLTFTVSFVFVFLHSPDCHQMFIISGTVKGDSDCFCKLPPGLWCWAPFLELWFSLFTDVSPSAPLFSTILERKLKYTHIDTHQTATGPVLPTQETEQSTVKGAYKPLP